MEIRASWTTTHPCNYVLHESFPRTPVFGSVVFVTAHYVFSLMFSLSLTVRIVHVGFQTPVRVHCLMVL